MYERIEILVNNRKIPGGTQMLDATGVCEADKGVFFYNFMNGRGMQRPEELNGRSPKNEAPDQRGIKIKPQMGKSLKIFGATRHIWAK